MKIVLSDQQYRICHAVVAAAFMTAKELSLKRSYEPTFQIYTHVDEDLARNLKPYFDLFQMVKNGEYAGLRRITGVADAEKLAAIYRKSLEGFIAGECDDKAISDTRETLSSAMQTIKAEHKKPPRILYIADCHFYHDRICREMDNRGFSGYEEMNEHMIAQWNAKVTAKDDVYILGDFCITCGDAAERILSRLSGKMHLIIGNHDKYLEDKRFEEGRWFRSVEPYQEIRDNGRTVILSHYPVFCYKGQYRRDKQGRPLTYMLYGHVHNTQDEALINHFIMETRATLAKSRHADQPEPIPCNMINCFCMFSDYQPMTLDEWIKIDERRREKLCDQGDQRHP